METITLNTGIELPIVGTGTNTYGKENNDYQGKINGDTTELDQAISLGYRHIDTAISYRNESVIGDAVKKSKLPREEFFLTSKIPGRPEYIETTEAVHQAVADSLNALKTDYIDLYLIHHPWDNNEEIFTVWRILEEYVDKGVLKAIGVSNFNQEQLGFILERARIKPAVNQIQSNTSEWNHAIIEYCQEHGVVPEAWGPLSRIDASCRQALTEIAQRYGKTWAQVILRYQIQRGVAVIPKSHNPERQQLNIELFDFSLTEEEMTTIGHLKNKEQNN